MIIKSFVALGFVIKVDDMFSENFPDEIKDTANAMTLTIGKDQNTFKKIWKRIKAQSKSSKKKMSCGDIFMNVTVNLWYKLLNNFYIVIYYYFMPLTCILM